MTVPGDQSGASGGASPTRQPGRPRPTRPAKRHLSFARTTENASPVQALLRDIVISGTVASHGQSQTILSGYNIQPQLKTVNARGAVLSRVSEDDLMDHIGFPVPELPARRVGKGDRWVEPLAVPLNWDESTRANVTAECSLEGFELQNNYPTAKIRETYSGPARFTSQPSTVSGHGSLPPISASAITYDRVIYFAYGSDRVIKETTKTQITLTTAQLTLLGGTPPVSVAFSRQPRRFRYPGAGYPGGPNPGVNNQSFPEAERRFRLIAGPDRPAVRPVRRAAARLSGQRVRPSGEPVRTSLHAPCDARRTRSRRLRRPRKACRLMALRLETTPPDDHEEKKAELTEHLAELRTRLHPRLSLRCPRHGGDVCLLQAHLPSPLRAVCRLSRSCPADFVSIASEAFFLKLQISMVGGLILAGRHYSGTLGIHLTRTDAYRAEGRLLCRPDVRCPVHPRRTCAYLILPMAIRWFLSYLTDFPNAVLFQNPLNTSSLSVKLLLVFGVIFQLPVVLMFLGKVGILTSAIMIKYWRQMRRRPVHGGDGCRALQRPRHDDGPGNAADSALFRQHLAGQNGRAKAASRQPLPPRYRQQYQFPNAAKKSPHISLCL